MSINDYFNKVKTICREISKLDTIVNISKSKKSRIIIYGLNSGYKGFISAIQGWSTQPSLVILENLLARQEALAK